MSDFVVLFLSFLIVVCVPEPGFIPLPHSAFLSVPLTLMLTSALPVELSVALMEPFLPFPFLLSALRCDDFKTKQ